MNKFKVMHLLSFSRDRCSRTYNYYARHFVFVLLQTSFYDESTNCKVANSERKNKNLVFIYCFKNELHFARDWHNETKEISLKWFCFLLKRYTLYVSVWIHLKIKPLLPDPWQRIFIWKMLFIWILFKIFETYSVGEVFHFFCINLCMANKFCKWLKLS